MEAIEAYSRILTRDNEVAVRWVAAHSGASGNEVADEYAKSTATGDALADDIPKGYSDETSYMTKVATEARPRESAEWIPEHVRAERRYSPPPGRGLCRPQLRKVRKTLTGRYY